MNIIVLIILLILISIMIVGITCRIYLFYKLWKNKKM